MKYTLWVCIEGIVKLTEHSESFKKILASLELVKSMEDDEVQLRDLLLKFEPLLKKTQDITNKFVSRIENCFTISGDDRRTIKLQLRTNGVAKLNEYTATLFGGFDLCGECYQEFKCILRDTTEVSDDVVKVINEKKRGVAKEGRLRRWGGKALKAIGVGTFAVGAVGTATVVGLATGGVCYPAALGVAAAATGSAAAGGPVGIVMGSQLCKAGDSYSDTERALVEISCEFQNIANILTNIDNCMANIKLQLECLQNELKKVTSADSFEDRKTFGQCVDALLDEIENVHDRIILRAFENHPN